jgi:hypothetical protein
MNALADASPRPVRGKKNARRRRSRRKPHITANPLKTKTQNDYCNFAENYPPLAQTINSREAMKNAAEEIAALSRYS